MISILAQERLLGAALGAAFAGFIVYEQRKRIYQSISPEHPQSQVVFEIIFLKMESLVDSFVICLNFIFINNLVYENNQSLRNWIPYYFHAWEGGAVCL
uniref:Uncharacterized protein n=1 Tax=Populus trichocarpa TaxID=3694 RepID=A9PFG6_POPTR|nr:unknown [Populus trichocarpa]